MTTEIMRHANATRDNSSAIPKSLIALIVFLAIFLILLVTLRPTFGRYGANNTPVLQTTIGYVFPGLIAVHDGEMRYLFMNGSVQGSTEPFNTTFTDINGTKHTFTSH